MAAKTTNNYNNSDYCGTGARAFTFGAAVFSPCHICCVMNCLKAGAQTSLHTRQLTNFIADDDNKDKRVHVAATDYANVS